jgi:hypothetical protein
MGCSAKIELNYNDVRRFVSLYEEKERVVKDVGVLHTEISKLLKCLTDEKTKLSELNHEYGNSNPIQLQTQLSCKIVDLSKSVHDNQRLLKLKRDTLDILNEDIQKLNSQLEEAKYISVDININANVSVEEE